MGLHTVYSTGYSLLGHHSTGHWALGTLADQHKQTWQRSPWVLGSIIPGTLLPFVGPLWAVTRDKSFTCSEKGIVRLNMAASSSLGLCCSLALAVSWPLLFLGPCCSMALAVPWLMLFLLAIAAQVLGTPFLLLLLLPLLVPVGW